MFRQRRDQPAVELVEGLGHRDQIVRRPPRFVNRLPTNSEGC
jgi:hypothetical protein